MKIKLFQLEYDLPPKRPIFSSNLWGAGHETSYGSLDC